MNYGNYISDNSQASCDWFGPSIQSVPSLVCQWHPSIDQFLGSALDMYLYIYVCVPTPLYLFTVFQIILRPSPELVRCSSLSPATFVCCVRGLIPNMFDAAPARIRELLKLVGGPSISEEILIGTVLLNATDVLDFGCLIHSIIN